MSSTGGEHGDDEQWHVECHLAVAVDRDATLALELAPAVRPASSSSRPSRSPSTASRSRPRPCPSHHGGTIHLVRSPRGALTIDLVAEVTRSAVPEVAPTEGIDIGQLTYRRQSRYCPSDELVSFASHEIGELTRPGAAASRSATGWPTG